MKLDKWKWVVTFDDNKKPIRLIGTDQNKVVRFDSDKDFNVLPRTKKPPVKTTPLPVKKEEKKPIVKTKQKLSETNYKQALESVKIDALINALTTRDLTSEQLTGISKRIAELKAKSKT